MQESAKPVQETLYINPKKIHWRVNRTSSYKSHAVAGKLDNNTVNFDQRTVQAVIFI